MAREQDAVRVIVVNDTWMRVPTADILFASDGGWWNHVRERDPHKGLRNVEAARAGGFSGEMWTTAKDTAAKYGLRWINSVRMPGITRREVTIHHGGSGGYMAINLAYLLGAIEIALVGYDMQGTHWFGEHDPALNKGKPYASWLQKYPDLARDLRHMGVDVVNCTERTALKAFRQETLETTLHSSWRDVAGSSCVA